MLGVIDSKAGEEDGQSGGRLGYHAAIRPLITTTQRNVNKMAAIWLRGGRGF